MINFSASTLELQTECFEGPLPVLITLIKRNKIDIFDIPIGQIAKQFLIYVDLAREMDLKIAEDFIEMASLLIFIKSRMLLPVEGEDPREELVEKIIEYEKLRAMAKSLDDFPVLGRDIFSRNSVIEEEEEEDVFSLCALFLPVDKEQGGALSHRRGDTADTGREVRRDQGATQPRGEICLEHRPGAGSARQGGHSPGDAGDRQAEKGDNLAKKAVWHYTTQEKVRPCPGVEKRKPSLLFSR